MQLAQPQQTAVVQRNVLHRARRHLGFDRSRCGMKSRRFTASLCART
jgi:hypothetical protein